MYLILSRMMSLVWSGHPQSSEDSRILEERAFCLPFQSAGAKVDRLKHWVSSLASRISGLKCRILCLSPVMLNVVVLFVILEY